MLFDLHCQINQNGLQHVHARIEKLARERCTSGKHPVQKHLQPGRRARALFLRAVVLRPAIRRRSPASPWRTPESPPPASYTMLHPQPCGVT
jgi:hypothetical protein